MARRVFCSFNCKSDYWSAAQVRNMGIAEGNRPASDNDWETITLSGGDAIKRWIADQMTRTSCTVIPIGTNTAGHKWINHEIIEAWNNGIGILGVYINNLKDLSGNQSINGSKPFDFITLGTGGGLKLSSIARAYNAPYYTSTMVHDYMKQNLATRVKEAIRIRNNY